MPKRSKKNQKKRPREAQPKRSSNQLPEESRGAVAANVLWMLSLMATLAAEAVGVACQVYYAVVDQAEIIRVMGSVMLAVAFLCGLATLVLIPVVLKVTKTRPPSLIVQVAALAGILPIVTLAIRSYSG